MKIGIEHILVFIVLVLAFCYVAKPKLIFGNEALNSVRYTYFKLDDKTKEYLEKHYREQGEKQAKK